MGLQAKPIGKFRGVLRKIEDEKLNRKEKLKNATKPSKKKTK